MKCVGCKCIKSEKMERKQVRIVEGRKDRGKCGYWKKREIKSETRQKTKDKNNARKTNTKAAKTRIRRGKEREEG